MEHSTINKYTNAKGVSHDAHFNSKGKYIGSVKKLGSEPIIIKNSVVKENLVKDVNFSTINKYTNAKGVSHDAHFNSKGKYIGSVKKLGSEPIIIKKTIMVDGVLPVECIPLENHLFEKIQRLEFENQELCEKISKLYVLKL